MEFSSFFSDREVILQLCKERVKLAKQRHEAMFLFNIDPRNPKPKLEKPLHWDEGIALDIFPPRRAWKSFRARRSERDRSSIDVNLNSLIKAVLTLRKENPTAPWVQRLNEVVKRIRERALSDQQFAFGAPTVLAEEKEKGSGVFRPLSVFRLEDKLIERQTASYLRRTLDYLFLPSCLAFRCSRNRVPPPTIHDALERIVSFRGKPQSAPVFVAECDIKGFFDCVPHDLARRSVEALIREYVSTAAPAAQHIDQRAWTIFVAYLNAYCFQRNVKLGAEPQLKKKRRGACFKWPEAELLQLHGSLGEIGVPQGGALSCLIANAVLHAVDKELEGIASRYPGEFLYLRYCDDMILLAKKGDVCLEGLEAYCSRVEELGFLIHPCKDAGTDKSFYSGKSHNPYPWGGSQLEFPWIQFVGYQVRHDGMVRVRLKSLKKQRRRITEVADEVLATLNPGRKRVGEVPALSPTVRRTAQQIKHRLRQRLISISVGRRKLGQDLSEIMPMCWCHGFRGLKGRSIIESSLKMLDRHRERQIMRVARRLNEHELSLPKATDRSPVEALNFYGMPFSYCGQFNSRESRVRKP